MYVSDTLKDLLPSNSCHFIWEICKLLLKTVHFYNNIDILLEKNIEAHCTSISCTFNVQCINNNIDVSQVKQKHYTVVNVFEKKSPKLQTLDFVDTSFELTLTFKHKCCNYLCQFTLSRFSQHLYVHLLKNLTCTIRLLFFIWWKSGNGEEWIQQLHYITFGNSLFLFMNCLAVHLAYTAQTILYSCKFLDTIN